MCGVAIDCYENLFGYPHQNRTLNFGCNTLQIEKNVPVGKPQNKNTKRLQISSLGSILLLPLRFVMLRTVNFNCQLSRSTIKIKDIGPNALLACEFVGAGTQIFIPLFALRIGHIFAQRTNIGKIVGIMRQAHRMVRPLPAYHLGGSKGATPPTSLALGHLPSKGRHYPCTNFSASSSPTNTFSSAAVKPRRTQLCTVTARWNLKGRQKLRTSLGMVRGRITAVGNSLE